MNLEREVIERLRIDRVAVQGQRQCGQVLLLGDVEELRFGHLRRHTFQRTDVHHSVNRPRPPVLQRRAYRQHGFTLQTLWQVILRCLERIGDPRLYMANS